MRVLTKEEFQRLREEHLNAIRNGAIFIYPTDTIYGIGCNALNAESVAQIRSLKKRPEAPFSVIAPSKAWIAENCIVTPAAREWILKLPGPYTLVLKLKNKSCIAPDVIPNSDSLGVRIPRHWFSGVVAECGVPIVTTSVNEAGRRFLRSADDLETEFRNKVHFFIDEGAKDGAPSNIIFLDKDAVEIRDRSGGQQFPDKKKA